MEEIKTKEDLYEALVKKAPIDKNEFEVKYNEFKKKSTEWAEMDAIKSEEIEKTALGQLHSYYIKVIESTASRFQGYLLGIIGDKDFGASNMYKKAKELWEENKDTAMNVGVEHTAKSSGKTYYIKCDVDGNPLYPVGYGGKAGKPIDLIKDKSKELLLLAKKIDGENPDTDFRKTVLTLEFDKFNIDKPFFQDIEFLANIDSNRTTENMYILRQASATEFVVKDKKIIDMNELITKYFSENKVKLNELDSWHEQNANNFDRLAFIKGFSSSINLSAPFSNILNITDLDSGTSITCFVDRDIPMNFPENIPGVIAFGRTRPKKDDPSVIQISAYGVFASGNFMNTVEKPDEEKIKEKTEVKKSFEGVEIKEKIKTEKKGDIPEKKKDIPVEEPKKEEKSESEEDW